MAQSLPPNLTIFVSICTSIIYEGEYLRLPLYLSFLQIDGLTHDHDLTEEADLQLQNSAEEHQSNDSLANNPQLSPQNS